MPSFIDPYRRGHRVVLAAVLCTVVAGCTFVPQREASTPAASESATGDPSTENHPAVSAAVQADFDAAVAAMQAKRWAEAEPKLLQLTEQQPQLSGPFFNLALLYGQTGKPTQAEHYFQRAIEVNPNNLAARNQYGIWLREQGRFHDAETAYQQALSRRADFADTHLNLGILYELYLGRLPEALQHYQRYLELQGETVTPVQGWVAELQRRLQSAG